MAEKDEGFDPFENELVPKHEVLNSEERAEMMKKLNISAKGFPRIKEDDPIVKRVGAKRGDVLRITRKSLVAGEYYYYRVVA